MSKTISKRHFLIYKTTNIINGKIYIGKHIAKNIDDGYMGSGKYIKRAIKKYGIENFEREILFHCETEDEMNDKEAELVTEEFISLNTNYNICIGGQGGFSYINKNILDYKTRSKRSKSTSKQRQSTLDDKFSKEEISSWSIKGGTTTWNRHKEDIKNRIGHTKGMFQHTEETKEKMIKSSRKSRPVEIDGIKYNSMREATRKLGLHMSKIRRIAKFL